MKCVTVRKASSVRSPSRLLSDPIVALIYLCCCFRIFYRSVASSLVVSRSETREACWITFWLPSYIDREGKYCFSRLGRTTDDLKRFLRLLIMQIKFLVFFYSVAYVSRSGGMSNELNNIISRTTDGVYEGVAIGGDRYPGSTFLDHVMRYQKNPDVKMIVVLGEVNIPLDNVARDVKQCKS